MSTNEIANDASQTFHSRNFVGIINIELLCPLDHFPGFFTGAIFDWAVPKVIHNFMEIFVYMLKSEFSLINKMFIVGAVPPQLILRPLWSGKLND